MKQINVGVIGGGFMCKAHSNAYKTSRYIFSDLGVRAGLEAICVRKDDRAAALEEKFEFKKHYINIDDILNDENIDLFDICVPAETHAEVFEKVIEKAKPVLCEKPLALNSGDALKMLKAAEKAGVNNYVGFNYRFLPAVRAAREMLAGGELGAVRHARVSYFQPTGADVDKFYENCRYVRTPGCGSLQEIGTHAIDQLRFLIGEFKTVSAMTSIYTPTRKTAEGETLAVTNEDAAAALITFECGATGVLECSSSFWGTKNRLSWEIFCTEGTVTWNLENPNYLNIYKKGRTGFDDGFITVNVTGGDFPYGKYWWPGSHNLGWEHGQINMIAGILENEAAGRRVQPVATFKDGYRAAAIVDAIRKSSKTGEKIVLTDEFRD